MDKMHVSEFCGIAEDGMKADAIGKAFEMYDKALNGEFLMDKSQLIHNHVSKGTIWLFANLTVDLGFVNHPFFIEAYKNVMKGEAATPIGTASFDSMKGTQTKKSAPGLDAWNKYKTPGFTWTVMQGYKKNKVWPENFSLNYFNPITGGRQGGVLEITTEQLFAINPQWENLRNSDKDYCVYLPAHRETGKVKQTNKYFPYVMETA